MPRLGAGVEVDTPAEPPAAPGHRDHSVVPAVPLLAHLPQPAGGQAPPASAQPQAVAGDPGVSVQGETLGRQQVQQQGLQQAKVTTSNTRNYSGAAAGAAAEAAFPAAAPVHQGGGEVHGGVALCHQEPRPEGGVAPNG